MANQVEMLSGRRKKDYAAESAAEALAAQADRMGVEPHDLAEIDATGVLAVADDDDEEEELSAENTFETDREVAAVA